MRTATLLVLLHAAALLGCTVAFAAGHPDWLTYAIFSTANFWRGWIWTPLTYGWVHNPHDVLWFAWGMYMLWVFGGQVEQFFGRRLFLKLYALLWLLTPILLLAFSSIMPAVTAGSDNAELGIFIAFATLYPGAQFFFGLTAKWIAVIIVAAYSVQAIAGQQLIDLALLWATVGAAWSFVRYQRGEFWLPKFQIPRRRPKFRVVPRPAAPPRRAPMVVSAGPMEDIDALLDKIARTGLQSLSESERARLERASAELKNTSNR